MGKSKSYRVQATYRVARTQINVLLDECRETRRIVKHGQTTRSIVCRLDGVPARRVDVIVDERIWYSSTIYSTALEVVDKRGCYNRAPRPRLAIRVAGSRENIEGAEFVVDAAPGRYDLQLIQGEAAVWSLEVERLRSTLDGYNLGRVAMWHAARYYKTPFASIDHDQIRTMCDLFPAWWAACEGVEVEGDPRDYGTFMASEGYTLADANRAASRFLYAEAKSLGWCKLTAAARDRLGLGAMWQRQDFVEGVRMGRAIAMGHASGTGDYTRDAALGGAVEAFEIEGLEL